jgi:hypothetical protein
MPPPLPVDEENIKHILLWSWNCFKNTNKCQLCYIKRQKISSFKHCYICCRQIYIFVTFVASLILLHLLSICCICCQLLDLFKLLHLLPPQTSTSTWNLFIYRMCHWVLGTLYLYIILFFLFSGRKNAVFRFQKRVELLESAMSLQNNSILKTSTVLKRLQKNRCNVSLNVKTWNVLILFNSK